MPRGKDVSVEHPLSAAERRTSRAQDIVEKSDKIFEKIDKEKEQQSQRLENVSNETIKSLKELIYYGSLSKTVELEGFYFQIKTLSNKEGREISKRFVKMSDELRLSDSNTITLAYAIRNINGLTPREAYREIFEKECDTDSEFDACFEILSNLNINLVSRLMDEYIILNQENKRHFAIPKDDEEGSEQSAVNLKK